MRAARTRGALPSVTLLVLLAAGCGIRGTDVVEAGEPALVEVVPAGQLGAVLYFVSSSSASRLMPVVRYADSSGGSSGSGTGSGSPSLAAARALDLLFDGPTGAESEAGLRSELPGEHVKTVVELSAEGVQVTLNTRVTGLSASARQQLLCTAAQARTADRGEPVTVTGTDGVIGPARCGI
ncbi:hypothetical protein [Streptomyces sp. NBC_00338]|uniref:hypothetical protein n=1 Tax=unclassified Streptomyces TaxID=2593676 RepID=UPI00225BBEB0|nr:hypothetical protein [Streptomyces sp. NBC_00338]MCX5143982.1 hypothetical protein [Streptomyces sp. NBC_00338]WSU62327.1 hypothetical protein OG450_32760 [Streptomyces sp. NBC_01104]